MNLKYNNHKNDVILNCIYWLLSKLIDQHKIKRMYKHRLLHCTYHKNKNKFCNIHCFYISFSIKTYFILVCMKIYAGFSFSWTFEPLYKKILVFELEYICFLFPEYIYRYAYIFPIVKP